MERLDAEAESDATTAGGGVIVGDAAAVDTTETSAVARIRRTLPPGVSGATFVLHLRVACLVICVLRSFSRNGIGGGTEDFDFGQQEAAVGDCFRRKPYP